VISFLVGVWFASANGPKTLRWMSWVRRGFAHAEKDGATTSAARTVTLTTREDWAQRYQEYCGFTRFHRGSCIHT